MTEDETVGWHHRLNGRESESRSVMSDSLRPHELYSPWNFPSQNTGLGSLSLPQGMLPTQGSNPCLLRWQADSLPLSYQGSPRGIYSCVLYFLIASRGHYSFFSEHTQVGLKSIKLMYCNSDLAKGSKDFPH